MAPLTKHRTLILGLLLMMIVGLPALAAAHGNHDLYASLKAALRRRAPTARAVASA